jgi:hypothetical protein
MGRVVIDEARAIRIGKEHTPHRISQHNGSGERTGGIRRDHAEGRA